MTDKPLSERLEELAKDMDDYDFVAGNFDMETITAAIELTRRVESAPVGTVVGIDLDADKPTWHVMDDRDGVRLDEPKRVRLVEDK